MLPKTYLKTSVISYLAETRALRQELMDEVGNDLDALVSYLQEREREHPERLVSLPPRAPEVTSARDGKSGA